MENYIKIAYFPSTASRETVIGSNGKNITNFCTKCTTEEDLNSGNYVLDATFLLEASECLQEESIIKVKMDYGYEVFRISKVTKSLRYIDIVARQITIADTLAMWLDDVRPTDTNGQGALSHIIANAVCRKKEITFFSDIDKTSTAYYETMNVYKAISDCDQSFIKRWGGEILRRGYNLYINKRVGRESGISIREGKNLTGFNGVSNVDELVTRAMGKGYNGIKGDYIDSPLINNYANIYNSVIEFSDVRLKSDETDQEPNAVYFNTLEEAKAELNNRIRKKYEDENIDKLKATYTVNFVELEKSTEYKDYAPAEKVNIGDTIRVYVDKVKCDIKVRAIKKKYDVMAQKTTEISLSNEVVVKGISISTVINELQKIEATTGNPVGAYINAMQQAGLQNSYIVCRENEFLALDTKDINTAKNVVKINNKGLFFSQTGYYGNYECGFTIDGVINANLIRTGILTAITIKSVDDSFIMNLGDNGGCTFYSKNKMAMQLQGTQLKFYNWGKDGDYIGSIGSLNRIDSDYPNGNPNKPFIGIWNDVDSALTLSYTTNNITSKANYMTFDKNKVIYDIDYPIQTWEQLKFNKDICIDKCKLSIGADGDKYLANGLIQTVMGGSLLVTGDLRVNGNKNCIQDTNQYGKVPFYSVEDINSLLSITPIDVTYKTELNENTGNYCKVIDINTLGGYLPNGLMRDCLNTDLPYNVYIDKMSFGDYYIKKYSGYFIIFSDREMEFKFKIEARRKNFENSNINKHLREIEKVKVGESND